MTVNHDLDCPCMYRLSEVAGELHTRETPKRHASVPAPRAMPLTGVFTAMSRPSTVIVSDLLADVLPAGFAGDVMLLPSDTAQHEIPLSESDVEEIADILVPREISFVNGPRGGATMRPGSSHPQRRAR